jgi:hypothetical protein
VIETLRALAAALAAPGVTTEDVLARLDGTQEDRGSNVIVENPAVDGVTEANVVRDGAAPAHVTLQLATPLSAGDLEGAFGEPRRAYPDHPGEPVDLLFELPVAVTLIAAESADGVRAVTLRRD